MTALAFHVNSPTRHAQIRMLSRFFALLFGALSVLFLAYVLMLCGAALIENPYFYINPMGVYLQTSGMPPDVPDVVLLTALPLWHRAFLTVCLVAMYWPGLMAFLNVRALFRLYAAGVVFAAENARRFRHIGLWLIAYALARGAGQLVMRLTDTAIDRNWFHEWEVHAVILGGLLFVISLVMEVGREIEQERAEFV